MYGGRLYQMSRETQSIKLFRLTSVCGLAKRNISALIHTPPPSTNNNQLKSAAPTHHILLPYHQMKATGALCFRFCDKNMATTTFPSIQQPRPESNDGGGGGVAGVVRRPFGTLLLPTDRLRWADCHKPVSAC